MVTSTPAKIRNRNNHPRSPAMRTLRHQAATVRKDAWDLAGSAGAVAREQFDPVRDYVLEKPIQSLLIAGGVGVILGFLFGRR